MFHRSKAIGQFAKIFWPGLNWSIRTVAKTDDLIDITNVWKHALPIIIYGRTTYSTIVLPNINKFIWKWWNNFKKYAKTPLKANLCDQLLGWSVSVVKIRLLICRALAKDKLKCDLYQFFSHNLLLIKYCKFHSAIATKISTKCGKRCFETKMQQWVHKNKCISSTPR